eukprot:TRINITY_DN15544_c0_g6_i1.p1 TRINITY_DN15544_c0_g6~~TRINITY_DN15544_c0_g6_i1.p1  ORF type:complete len:104 (-),score=1.39 TRINITY_DN15544_c0_g6_i1:99-410(-)
MNSLKRGGIGVCVWRGGEKKRRRKISVCFSVCVCFERKKEYIEEREILPFLVEGGKKNKEKKQQKKKIRGRGNKKYLPTTIPPCKCQTYFLVARVRILTFSSA